VTKPGDVIELPTLKPVSAAKFVRELGAGGHAARPSLKTQQRLAELLDYVKRHAKVVA
jgi:hypothetical protein